VSRQQANQESEADATVFSQKSHITEDNEDSLTSPVKRVDFNLENKRSNQGTFIPYSSTQNQEIVKRIDVARSGTNSDANSLVSKQNSINQVIKIFRTECNLMFRNLTLMRGIQATRI